MNEAEQFFYDHAGYSYNPQTETEDDGRHRTATELADAERYARDHGWEVEWEDDWTVGNHFREYGEAYSEGEPKTCERAVLHAPWMTYPLASLGCIDDASSEYRRVVEAELARDVVTEYRNHGSIATLYSASRTDAAIQVVQWARDYLAQGHTDAAKAVLDRFAALDSEEA